jgi:hypothetical protein
MTNTKSTWPKPGSRIEPTVYEKIRELAHQGRVSFNDMLNLLLQEALAGREARQNQVVNHEIVY